MDNALLHKRLLEELRSSRYQATAEYALRDFGTALTPVLDAAIAAGEVEVVEVRTNTTRFPNIPVRFVKAVGWDRGVQLTSVHAPYALLFGNLVLTYGKTTKTACGKRVATDKLVSRDETDCTDCLAAIAADADEWDGIKTAAEEIQATLTSQASVTLVAGGGYVRATCTCGWNGPLVLTRTVEGHSLAKRDADDHNYAHANGLGFFDFTKGWVEA